MGIDLEDELREAFTQLPREHHDPADVLANARASAHRHRRHRTAGICAGAVAATLVVGAALGGALARSVAPTTTAGAPAAPTRLSTPSPVSTAPTPASLRESVPGLTAALLPHGAQLPPGLLYRGTTPADIGTASNSSGATATSMASPIHALIGTDTNAGEPSTEQRNATYGLVEGIIDVADTGSTSKQYRTLTTSIVRFRSAAFAQSAITKAQRDEAGMFWMFPKLTRPNIAWSGVPGAVGEHGVYDVTAADTELLGHKAPRDVAAYQVVGIYLVSAESESPATAEQAVTDAVTNLKTEGLLK